MDIREDDVKVLGRVVATTTEGIVADAEQLYDPTYRSGMFLSEINQYVRDIDDVVFPLVVSASLSSTLAEYTGTAHNVTASWEIRRRGNLLDPTSISLTQKSGSDTIELSPSISAQGSVIASVNYRGTTTFNLNLEADELEYSTILNYILVAAMYFGFSPSSSDITPTSLTKQPIKTSPSGTYTINNPTTGYYLWLCVPDNMTIDRVTSSGFDVPMNSYVNVTTDLCTYRCYRSASAINAGNMTFTIS